jgi:hypothetical protein
MKYLYILKKSEKNKNKTGLILTNQLIAHDLNIFNDPQSKSIFCMGKYFNYAFIDSVTNTYYRFALNKSKIVNYIYEI